MRRIRSNLRTFRLLLDPAWGTSLRAELAWYGRPAGRGPRPPHHPETITVTGPERHRPRATWPDSTSVVDGADGRRPGRHRAPSAAGPGASNLTEQMMVLWDGPAFKAKASRPAEEVLPVMLHRAWHDLRGAAGTARKDPTDENLHKVRIRMKDLRYGCNTVALIEGGPARKTAKAAERLQIKLGDLHDACYSIDWLEALADERPDLAEPIDALVYVADGRGRRRPARGGSASSKRSSAAGGAGRLSGHGGSADGGCTRSASYGDLVHPYVVGVPQLDAAEDAGACCRRWSRRRRGSVGSPAASCRHRCRGGRRTSGPAG